MDEDTEELVDMDVPRIYAGEARLLGATFNRETKTWQAPKGDIETFAHVDRNQMTPDQLAEVKAEIDAEKANRQYLNVSYENKDRAKELGARYDGEEKAWYVEKGVDIKPFADIDMNQWTDAKKQEHQKQKQEQQAVADRKKVGEWIPMDIHYNDRKEAAKLGGHYNKDAKRWEAHSAETLGKFAHIDRNQMTPEQRKEHSERINQELAAARKSAGEQEQKPREPPQATQASGLSQDTKAEIAQVIDKAIAMTKEYQAEKKISPGEEHATDEAIACLRDAKAEFMEGKVGDAAFSMHCACQIEKYNPMENLSFSTNAAREIDAVMANEIGKAQWQVVKDQNIEADLEEPAIAESQKRNVGQKRN